MQIVIDIPDYDYRQIKEYYEKNDTVEATYSYIYHGTPLPKGHGRLIDADKADDIARETRTDEDGRIIRNFLNTLRPIIEADKAESEK